MSDHNDHVMGPLRTWANNNPLAVATLLGGVIYVFVFESYRSVLRPFGVTPGDVGIDYTDVIWPVVQSAGFLVFYLMLIAALACRSRTVRDFLMHSHNRQMGIVIVSVVFVIVILSGLAIAEMVQYRNSVEAGRPYEPVFSSRLQVLSGLRANRVKVVWKNTKESRPHLPGGALLFLGAADGISILYSQRSGETLRVASRDILLSTMRTQESGADQHQSNAKPTQ